MTIADQPTFEEFRQQWLEEVEAGNPTSTDLGHRFARKLFTQWLDISGDLENFFFHDGPNDGGIDIAYLEEDAATGSSVWYLVQSKYSKKPERGKGQGELEREGYKVIETLRRLLENPESSKNDLEERLANFLKKASSSDQIKFVFATVSPLTQTQVKALNAISRRGQEDLSHLYFNVESVSIKTIYERQMEGNKKIMEEDKISLPIRGKFEEVKKDSLLIGTVTLFDLYQFLQAYKAKTGDLGRLYEKNVRRFLGGKGRINKGIRDTLIEQPEQFGLYNNGITFFATAIKREESEIQLIDPCLVNGCQTTSMIYSVLDQFLRSGGTGNDSKVKEWEKRTKEGVVITKIAVNSGENNLLINVTRYTNSQNAVYEKDFISLELDANDWQKSMAEQQVYLEVQRGGWDVYKSLHKKNPKKYPLKKCANLYELMKIYGAGWWGLPGLALSTNQPFVPGGQKFAEIMKEESNFGAEDILATYHLKLASEKLKFGGRGKRLVEEQYRRKTRFLFYFVIIEILAGILRSPGLKERKPTDLKILSLAINKLWKSSDPSGREKLGKGADNVIKEYIGTQGRYSIEKEDDFKDILSFLGSKKLGKEYLPRILDNLIELEISSMRRGSDGQDIIDIVEGKRR